MILIDENTSYFQQIIKRATVLRRHIHAHPELGFQEHTTCKTIATELKRLGISYKTGFAGETGIVALIEGKSSLKAKKCVALRADMDALPITEMTKRPWKSQCPGRMHACGHDGHTAILLGAAAALMQRRNDLNGTVKLIFQPAEEALNGGRRMVESGALAAPKVDAIFGLHGWPHMLIGTAGTKSDTFLAAVDTFNILIHGKGSHGAYPHQAIDPIACGAAIVQSLTGLAASTLSPLETVVLSFGIFNAGQAINVIPETAELSGTLRTLSAAARTTMRAAIERTVRTVGTAHRCRVRCQWGFGTPATVNDTAATAHFEQTATATLGLRRLKRLTEPFLWSEDFAYYLQETAGCFFVLGLRPSGAKDYPMLHNPQFDFPDAALPVGIKLMANLALNFLAYS